MNQVRCSAIKACGLTVVSSPTPAPGAHFTEPVLSAVHENLVSAVARGLGNLDFAALIRVVGENAGLKD
jgi:hypothetical protein